MYELAGWTKTTPADVFDLHSRADLLVLSKRYGGRRPSVFMEVVGQAHDLGARGVLVEYRYLDSDYRNEHSEFYSTTFRRYPSVAHRMHFFRQPFPRRALGRDATDFASYGYVGYAVLRPVPASTIGRTVLTPPGTLVDHVTCYVDDPVNVFGSTLTATGAPFMSQDAQLGVCIHVSAWTCAYYHHHATKLARVLPGDVARAAPVHLSRLVPAPYMTVEQLLAILNEVGLPPIQYQIPNLDAADDLFSIACRYLNSRFPVIVAGGGHSFVLVGYRRVRDEEGNIRTEFIRQDDQEGPYCIVHVPAHDLYRPWEYLVIPLPKKLYVSGDKAETIGAEQIVATLEGDGGPVAKTLLSSVRRRKATFRSYATLSNDFKKELHGRGAPPALVSAYSWMQMSRWIWVIEVVDREAWDSGSRSVLGEAVIDATDHTDDPRVLAWRVGDRLYHRLPDTTSIGRTLIQGIDSLRTGVAGDARVIDV